MLGLRQGLHAAFREHYLPLVRFSTLLLGRQEGAEDLVQEAFVRVATRLEDLEPGEVRPYLRATVANLWKNRLRRLALENRLRVVWPRRVPTDADQEERSAMWQAIKRLPPRQRACLVLRYYEDLPEQQIAHTLGISIGTVKSQTSRALARLRREFADED